MVFRWFWNADPAYLTLHVLGAHDEEPPPEDAWYPLEWANEEREFDRTDRILAHPEVVNAAAVLAATFPRDLGDRFAVSAAHFEGWGRSRRS